MLRPVVAVVFVALALVAVARGLWVELSDLGMLQQYLGYVNEMGLIGYVYLSLAYLVLAMTPVPLMPLTALGGFVMGFGIGFAFLWPASIISAAFMHWLGQRYLTKYTPLLLRRFPKADYLRSEAVKSHWIAVAINRLLPVCPFAIQNVVLGAIGLPVKAQVIGTALGIIPALSFALYCGTIAKILTEVLSNPAALMPVGRVSLLLTSVAVFCLVLVWIRKRLQRYQAVNEKVGTS
ncbi:MAG: TVP38/TMEM64 family protein [Bradymonadia bacterium]